MPVRNYGVLKGRVVRGIPERHGRSPHFQVLVDADGTMFRVAVGTRSLHGAPDLLYFADPDFEHPFLERLVELEDGFHPLEHTRESGALDYARGSLVRREQMRPLPVDLPGRDNDLNEKIGSLIDRARADGSARLYAFGGRWGPEPQARDVEFGFLPGNGVHEIHMNQGSPPGRHAHDNGPWQDGALLIHFAGKDRWTALFLAFQSQRWSADDPAPNPRNPLLDQHR